MTENPTKTKIWCTIKFVLGFAFVASMVWLTYWLLFVYQARNIYAIIAIVLFLAFPCLISLLKIPIEISRLMAIWRSDDPASLDKAIQQIRLSDPD